MPSLGHSWLELFCVSFIQRAWGSSGLSLWWLTSQQETSEEQKLWSGLNCSKNPTDAVLGGLITYWDSVLSILCDAMLWLVGSVHVVE